MPSAAAPEIAGISARLFLRDTGTLSPDLLRTPDLIGNTLTMGDSALVVITITDRGIDGGSSSNRVRLIAIEEAPTFAVGGARQAPQRVLNRTARVPPLRNGESIYVGFWVDHIGCAPLRLIASFDGGAPGASRQEVIGFQCYE
ncbi:hypothetical protein [Sphingomonas sp.]|uniref:hypothetical protein n=1 Tax=Sphingomonas sp. TaxID=28214 RepID=UPI003B3BB427